MSAVLQSIPACEAAFHQGQTNKHELPTVYGYWWLTGECPRILPFLFFETLSLPCSRWITLYRQLQVLGGCQNCANTLHVKLRGTHPPGQVRTLIKARVPFFSFCLLGMPSTTLSLPMTPPFNTVSNYFVKSSSDSETGR